jgi:O-succinylbenzoate synthase
MRIVSLSLYPYGRGLLLEIQDEQGRYSYGEVAPLPGYSNETPQECRQQLQKIPLHTEWSLSNYEQQLEELSLFPSVTFALESALLSLLDPLPTHTVAISALFMGSVQEILAQASQRLGEGYTVAKLKVAHLSAQDAASLIHTLKSSFRLRIDVNRAWDRDRSLEFFSQFPQDTFDYVEYTSLRWPLASLCHAYR